MSGIGAKALSKVRNMEITVTNTSQKNYMSDSLWNNNRVTHKKHDGVLECVITEKFLTSGVYGAVNVKDKCLFYIGISIKPKANSQLRISGEPIDGFIPNQWNKASVVLEGSEGRRVTLYHDTTVDEYEIGDSFFYKDLMTLNLTEVFGEGNEPSAEQMDIILSQLPNGWFYGTQSITKEFMIMLLSEINENRKALNAIVGD